MPRIAIDYSKTIIYKIVCNDLTITDSYVGSTTDFPKRKSSHKSKYNSVCSNNNYNNNNKFYKIIKDNGGWDNWSMIQIEEYTLCANSNQAKARVRHWIEELNAKLNFKVPLRTPEEYYKDNKEEIKIKYDKYNEDHKEKIKERNKSCRVKKEQLF